MRDALPEQRPDPDRLDASVEGRVRSHQARACSWGFNSKTDLNPTVSEGRHEPWYTRSLGSVARRVTGVRVESEAATPRQTPESFGAA